MYRCNLSFDQLEEYLSFLSERGLISQTFSEEDMHAIFWTTPRGVEFLKKYEGLKEIVDVDTDQKLYSTIS